MGNAVTPFTTEKTQYGNDTQKKARIIQLPKRKPKDISLYIDCEKGWKFTENDKAWLTKFYEDYIRIQNEEFDGDFVEESQFILNFLNDNGVEASKELIQLNAKEFAEAVDNNIYKYYESDCDILKLIENAILDIRW